MVAGPSLCSLRSRKCSLLQATEKATRNPTHSLLAGGRRAPHRQNGIDQAAERRASLCGFVRALVAAFKNGQSSPSRMVPICGFARQSRGCAKKRRKKRRKVEVARRGRAWQRTLPNRDGGDVTSLTRTELACVTERQYFERMPTVLRVGGFRFHFYSDEGIEPPLIHVRCAEGEC